MLGLSLLLGVPETVGGTGYAARMKYIPPCYVVYRVYRRTDGVLIYVGSTGRWGLRMADHERKQWW